jgi:hypothetical protein
VAQEHQQRGLLTELTAQRARHQVHSRDEAIQHRCGDSFHVASGPSDPAARRREQQAREARASAALLQTGANGRLSFAAARRPP